MLAQSKPKHLWKWNMKHEYEHWEQCSAHDPNCNHRTNKKMVEYKSVFGTFVVACDVVFIILGHCSGALYHREHVVIFSSDGVMLFLSLLCYFYVNVTVKCNKNPNITTWVLCGCVCLWSTSLCDGCIHCAIRLVAYAEWEWNEKKRTCNSTISLQGY